MNQASDIDALRKLFNAQNSELTRLREVLGSLDPRFGLGVDTATLEAIDSALDLAPRSHGPALLPPQGTRA